MKRLELVIVQFDEAKRLIEVGRIPQLRLAHILIDSAVELIMHRMVATELDREQFAFDQLNNARRHQALRTSKPQYRKFLGGPSDEQLSAEVKELEKNVTSKNRRKKIDHSFGEKVSFLVERQKLPGDLAAVLNKLHEYRNETYHRDQHRFEVLQPAVLIYFDAACTVLDNYEVGAVTISESPGPELARFGGSLFELPHRAAQQLRKEAGLDFATVREALVDHLRERLENLVANLEDVEANLQGEVIAGDAIRVMQLDDEDIEAIFNHDVLRARVYPVTTSDVKSWMVRATAMESMRDKHALFAEFAALEDAFESLERKVIDAVCKIEEAAEEWGI